MKKNCLSIFYKIAFLLVLFISMPTILASTLFFFNISINSYTFIIGELFSVLIYIFFFVYKNKDSKKETLIVFLSTITLIIIAFLLVHNVYDRSWDGNTYHIPAIDMLSNGWNPLLDHKELTGFGIWSVHYPKFIWIFAASIMALTGNILIGKMFTIIIIYITALISYDVLSRTKVLSPILALVFSILISLNPVIIPQINTYYNDGIVGNLIIIVCLLLYGVTKKLYDIEKDYTVLIFLGLLASILANVKYTGSLDIVVILSIYWIYLLFGKLIKNKKTFFIKSAIIIGFLVCTVAANTYLVNIVHHKNIGYPIVGENKIDILTFNTPDLYKDRNKFSSFVKSTLTYSTNRRKEEELTYKAPFTVTSEEIKEISKVDLRSGGFGVYFQLIMITTIFISIIIIVSEISNKNIKSVKGVLIYQKNLLNRYKEEFLLLFVGLVLFIITPMSWWARYIPYFYSFLLIYFIFITSRYKNEIYKNICIMIFLFLCILNTMAFLIVDHKAVVEGDLIAREKKEEAIDVSPEDGKIYVKQATNQYYYWIGKELDKKGIEYEFLDDVHYEYAKDVK